MLQVLAVSWKPDIFLFNFGLLDLVDILIVTALFYKLYIHIRGTKAFQMTAGLIPILIGSFLASFFKMHALSWLATTVQTVWVVAFVVLFQPELRVMLAQAGESRFFRLFFQPPKKEKLDEILNAVTRLSLLDIGALIVLTRDHSMDEFIKTGTSIQGAVSAELLVTIFMPKTPLHDGAVIISEETIIAAGVILPLSQSTSLPKELGTRHRAGIGITEESDAVVIIVSEETGKVSVAAAGQIRRNLATEELRRTLRELMTQ